MKLPKIIAYAAIWQFIGIAFGDEVRVSYTDTDIKAFRDTQPLHAEITRKDGKIFLSLTNVSKKHVTITKAPYSFRGHYEAADGLKLDEFGGATDAGMIELADHAVLRSKTKKDGEDVFDWSSWEIWETGASHKGASFLVFDLNLGGYFPEVGKYVSFKVSGRVGMSKDSGEQAGTGQPATRGDGDVVFPWNALRGEKRYRNTVEQAFPNLEFGFYHATRDVIIGLLEDFDHDRVMLLCPPMGEPVAKITRNGKEQKLTSGTEVTIKVSGQRHMIDGRIEDSPETAMETHLGYWIELDPADQLSITLTPTSPWKGKFQADYGPDSKWQTSCSVIDEGRFSKDPADAYEDGSGQPATRPESK